MEVIPMPNVRFKYTKAGKRSAAKARRMPGAVRKTYGKKKTYKKKKYRRDNRMFSGMFG